MVKIKIVNIVKNKKLFSGDVCAVPLWCSALLGNSARYDYLQNFSLRNQYSAKHFLITVFNISTVLQATSLAKVSEDKGKTEISPKYDNI